MISYSVRVLALSLVVIAFACKKELPEEQPQEVTFACEHSQESEMTDAYARWKSHSLTSYTIQQVVHGEVGSGIGGIVILTVKNNRITDVRRTRDGLLIPRERWGLFRTVDELFVSVCDLKKGEPAYPDFSYDLDVSYDTEYGYPKKISVGVMYKNAPVEDGITITTSEGLKF